MSDYSTGFFVGLLFAWIVIFINAAYRSRKHGERNDDYDERQMLVRYRAYQYCFFLMIVFLACTCLVESVLDKHIIDTDAVAIIGICLSVGVHVCYCIWNEGYFLPLNNNRKSFFILTVATAILFISFSIQSVQQGTIIVDGVLTGNCMELACAVLFTTVCIVFLIKRIVDKKEDEQQ